MLHKNCSFFQLGNGSPFGGAFLLSKAPKRAMLKAHEHLMDNAKQATTRKAINLDAQNWLMG
jgi:hypothetical protein